MKNIPIEIITPKMQRLEMAIKLYKSGKHITFIKTKLNEMIALQNELEKELGRVLTPFLSDEQVKAALSWAENKGLR